MPWSTRYCGRPRVSRIVVARRSRAQVVIQRGEHVLIMDRPRDWDGCRAIGLSQHLARPQAAAGQQGRPDARPMAAAAAGIEPVRFASNGLRARGIMANIRSGRAAIGMMSAAHDRCNRCSVLP
jgi:hypothetical protein